MSDLIERDKAVEALRVAYFNESIQSAKNDPCVIDAMTDWAIRQIKAIPSARPKGEWKPKNHHTDYCSNCGFEETQWRTADYNFCPSCGARMKGVDDV